MYSSQRRFHNGASQVFCDEANEWIPARIEGVILSDYSLRDLAIKSGKVSCPVRIKSANGSTSGDAAKYDIQHPNHQNVVVPIRELRAR
jgi:hypothetical protein